MVKGLVPGGSINLINTMHSKSFLRRICVINLVDLQELLKNVAEFRSDIK